MKRFEFVVAFVIGMFIVTVAGCGGVDVGSVPVDVGGITNNFGDINVGDVNGIGDAVEEAVAATEEAVEESEEVIEETAEPGESPHPADINVDFVLALDEVVAYAADFLDGGLPDGQTQAWVDVASGIALATYGGAYYDDMESPEPDNWKPLLDENPVDLDADLQEVEQQEVEQQEAEQEVEQEVEQQEVELDDEVEADSAAAGFDLLFKVAPLTSVPVELEVIDPNGNWNKDWNSLHELGWPEGTAWQGAYTVQVATRDNGNGVNEMVTFSLTVWVDGEVVHESEHAVAEGRTWDDLVVSY